MIAATAVLAASLLPGSVGVGISAPVCLPQSAQPGHAYPLSVGVQNTGTGDETVRVTVVPDPVWPASTLLQVPASWLSPASATLPAGKGTDIPLSLSVPSGAAPGVYWSHIQVTTVPGSTAGGVTTASGAFDLLILTVGPSAAPPCDALQLAESTGRFPAWPRPKFATTGWKQVYARERASEPQTPDGGPTAGTGTPARSSAAPAYSPAASTASASVGPNRDAWIVIAVLIAIGLVLLARRKSS